MILEAARREFADQGFEGATTASIARRVGVTQPLIHYHFGSKEALWHMAVSDLFSTLMAAIEGRAREMENMGPAQRLVSISHALIDFVIAHPELPRLINSEGSLETPRLSWLVERYLRPLVERWTGHLDAAKQAGIIKNLPNAFMVCALLGACQHFFDVAPLVRELFGVDPRAADTAHAYGDAIVELFLEGAATRRAEDA